MNHLRSIFVWILFGFVIGIVVQLLYPLYLPLLVSASFVSFFLVLTSRSSKFSLLWIVVISFCAGAIGVYANNIREIHHIDNFDTFIKGDVVRLQGIIVEDVHNKSKWRGKRYAFALKCQKIYFHNSWQDLKGKVLVNVFRDYDLSYGDIVILKGKLHRPFEFSDNKFSSYVDFLGRKGITHIFSVKKIFDITKVGIDRSLSVRRMLYRLRKRFIKVFDNNLTKSESGLMRAIILGDRTSLPAHIRDVFIRTGSAHILAMSGLHVGVVSIILIVIMRLFPIPFYYQYTLVLIFLLCFVCMSGLRPSIVRSFIMLAIVFGGIIFEKRSNILNNISMAALCILFFNPLLVQDIGFQMSFSCVFSIFVSLLILKKIKPNQSVEETSVMKKNIIDSLVISSGIWIGVGGLTVLYFGIITPISILVNIWLVPLVGVVVYLGVWMLIISMILPFLVPLFGLCLHIVLNLIFLGVFLFEKVPWGYFYLKDVSLWGVCGYYFLLFIIVYFLYRRMNHSPC